MKKVAANVDNDHKVIIDFVNETKEGKYTKQKPEIEFTYQRIEIQEQSETIDLDDMQDNGLLFGITS